MTQYNLGFEEAYPANSLDMIVNATLKARTAGQVLRVPIDIYNKSNGTGCVDWAQLTPANQVKNDRTGISWSYISCAWFVQSAVATGPDNSLFPPFLVNSSVTSCGNVAEWATPDYNKTNAEWVDKFSLSDAALDRVTRLLITHGSYDGTAAIGMPRLTSSGDRNHSRAILVTGMGHRENQNPEAVLPRGVRPQVDQVCILWRGRKLVLGRMLTGYRRFETRNWNTSENGLAFMVTAMA